MISKLRTDINVQFIPIRIESLNKYGYDWSSVELHEKMHMHASGHIFNTHIQDAVMCDDKPSVQLLLQSHMFILTWTSPEDEGS